jgi:hypothetical protein
LPLSVAVKLSSIHIVSAIFTEDEAKFMFSFNLTNSVSGRLRNSNGVKAREKKRERRKRSIYL